MRTVIAILLVNSLVGCLPSGEGESIVTTLDGESPQAPVVPPPPSGGPDDPPTPMPVGRWGGTLGGRAVHAVIRDDGEAWMLYTHTGNPFLAAGAWHGMLAVEVGGDATGTLTDFSTELPLPLPIGVRVAIGATTLRGTVRYSNGSTATLDLTRRPSEDQQPDAVLHRQEVHLFSDINLRADLIVERTGEVNGFDPDRECHFDGTLTMPAKDGAWDLTTMWRTDAEVCAVPPPPMRGVLFAQAVPDRMYVVVLSTDREHEFALMGVTHNAGDEP